MADHTTEETQPTFLTETQVAKLICQSVRTLQKWRMLDQGPVYYKFGQSVRYSSADVDAWIARRRIDYAANVVSLGEQR